MALTVDVAGTDLGFVDDGGQHSAPLEVRHLATDARNRLQPEFRHVTTMTLTQAQRARVEATGLRIVAEFELPAGRYQLRVASVSGARSGSVVYDLDVPDFGRDALRMSGVALTDPRSASVPTLQADASGRASRGTDCRPPRCTADVRSQKTMQRWPALGQPALVWQDMLASTPTTRRAFEAGETVTAFFEVYDNNRSAARQPEYAIDAVMTLRGNQGAAIRTVSQQRSSNAARRDSGGHAFVISMPLAGVSAGSYVLDVTVRSTRDTRHVASRRIPISVVPEGDAALLLGQPLGLGP